MFILAAVTTDAKLVITEDKPCKARDDPPNAVSYNVA